MIPLLIAAGVGAVAAGAGGAALAASRDRSSGGGAFGGWVDSKGNPVPEGTPGARRAGGYDANAYNYSNAGMSAYERQKMYDAQAEAAQKREAAQANYGAAQGVLSQGGGDQAEAIAMHREAALGGAPSVAQKQLQMGQDAAMRSQESMRASARGAAGVAMADYGAAANIAMAQQQTNAQSGLLRAQEMAQARDALSGAASAARAQNLQQGATMGGWEQYNAGLQMQQREANDRRDAAMRAAAEGVSTQQAQMQMANQQALQRAYEEQQAREAAARAGNNAANAQTVGMVVGGLSGAANAMGSAYSGGGPTKVPPTGGK